ncbi:MAG: GGDEF domain-containing protein [Rhodospirillales bacterium]
MISTASMPPGGEATPGEDQLVPSVARLIEHLHRQAARGTGEIAPHHGDVDRALVAAAHAERRIAALRHRIAQLERLAMTDELTGLLNRRGFENALDRTLALARRYDEPGLLIYVDLDGFKLVNDTYGHAAGDAVLRRVAGLLTDNLRRTDFVGRLGGDEFAMLLPRTSAEGGANRLLALRRLLDPVALLWNGATITVGASVGVETFGGDETGDGTRLLARADASMYRSKHLRADPTGRRLCG